MRMLLMLIAMALAGCGANVAQREQISATKAVVDQRVSAGQMSEAEGRLAMAKLKADIAAERRRNAIAMNGDGLAVYQPVGGGTVIRY